MKKYTFSARVQTLEGNYITICNVGYGVYLILWVMADMATVIRDGADEEWLWATSSWGQPVEHGDWDISEGYAIYQAKVEADFIKGKEVAYKYFTKLWHFDHELNDDGVKYGLLRSEEDSYTELHYAEHALTIYNRIAALPAGLDIIEMYGEDRSRTEYSGGHYAANVQEYTGPRPAIIKTTSEEYWRGNSSRGSVSYFLATEDGIEDIVRQVRGDGFGIVNSSNNNFSFEEIYAATH